MNENKKINLVMFNMSGYSEWQKGIQNRNYHLLEQFLRDERIGKIVAVDYLPHTFKRALRIYRDDLVKKSAHKVIFKSVFSKAVEVSDKLIVYSTVLNKFSGSLMYGELVKLLKSVELEDYLVWSCYPLDIGYFKELAPKLKIFDAVDNWLEHSSYKFFKKRLAENYKFIDNNADVIFTVSKEVQNLFNHKEKVYWVPNGVDPAHYQKKFTLLNRDIGEIKHPIIGYSGVIQERFDFNLLKFLATKNPDKSFVMVGPNWLKKKEVEFKKLPNVYFLGLKKYQDIAMYLSQFDVCILPHKIDQFSKSNDPMKIYEYLASGKPVVSTQALSLEKLNSLIKVCLEPDHFSQAIADCLKEDNEQLKKERIEAIKDQGWQKRAQHMLDLVEQKL